MANGSVPPVASVVVPAYRGERTIQRCIESLLGQEVPWPFEVILVVSADDETGLPRDLRADPRLRVERVVPRLRAAAARNRGVALAQGRWLLFTDADVVAPSDWVATMVGHLDERILVVAGGVRNGTPRSIAGTAEYLVEFSDLHPRRPVRGAWHGATCNLAIDRAAWIRYGPWPEDLDGGEDTLLTTAALADGTFRFAGDASVEHLNRTGVREVVRHQYDAGRYTARLVRRTTRYRFRPLVRYPWLVPLAVAGRTAAVANRSVRFAATGGLRTVAAGPLVLACLVAWGAGVVIEGRRRDRRAVRTRGAGVAAARAGTEDR